MGFDIGAVIGNLFLNYAAHGCACPIGQTRRFPAIPAGTVIDVWHVFVREFQRHVWDHVDTINMPQGYQDDYMLRLLQDSAGLGACKMMRRVIGLAGVEDIRGIEDPDDRPSPAVWL